MLFADFDHNLQRKDLKEVVNKMKNGFSGAHIYTLKKNLSQPQKDQFLHATHFKPSVVKSGEIKYEVCLEEEGGKCLEKGKDIFFYDLAPQKLSKSELISHVKKLNDSVRNDACQTETKMKLNLKKNWK